MAFSRVKKPAFYISLNDFAKINNNVNYELLNDDDLLRYTLNPSDYKTYNDINSFNFNFSSNNYIQAITDIFILGHVSLLSYNFYEIANDLSEVQSLENFIYDGYNYSISTSDGISAISSGNGYTKLSCNLLNNISNSGIRFKANNNNNFYDIGSIVLCKKYTMEHHPDLTLTQSIENESIKKIITKGGKYLSNSSWDSMPKWAGGFNAWTNLSGISVNKGRRIWDLNFSYLDDTQIYPEDYFDVSAIFDKNSFISSVWHLTNCGQLPFIFQPDDTVNQYAMAIFDMDSLDIQNQTPNTLNVTIKIKEVW